MRPLPREIIKKPVEKTSSEHSESINDAAETMPVDGQVGITFIPKRLC